MSREQELEEQLKLLRAMTEEYGSIHDAQAHQLKRYPFALANVTKAEVHVSVYERHVDYIVTRPTRSNGKLEEKAFKFIEKCVQCLLGDTWKVTIRTEKKVLFKGKRKKAYKPTEEVYDDSAD